MWPRRSSAELSARWNNNLFRWFGRRGHSSIAQAGQVLWTITLMILLYRLSWLVHIYDNDQSATPVIATTTSSTSSTRRSVLAPNNSPAAATATTNEEEEEEETTKTTQSPFVVAYAVSFIKCGDFRTQSADLTDASLILRHSIHQISSRNYQYSKSRYDYKMYALVHRQAVDCFQELNERTGFEVIVVDSPVRTDEIRGETLRKNIHRELCCGADEFIKLYAYSLLPHEIVVHVDIDFAFYKPMDDLFDALRYDKDSVLGRAARARIHLERPEIGLPDRIDAFLTKDWPQVAPGKFPAAYQAGFLVARRDPALLEEMLEVIREGNYTAGWGYGTGWGLAGYSGWVGAMTMQGFVAYFYDKIRPNTAVELNQCRYNHMGMDVRYRHPPNFRPSLPGVGGCRNGAKQCEDCMVTDPKDIHSVHYTMCRKPWQCMAQGAPQGKLPGGERASAINTQQVNLDHCLALVKKWHDLRSDYEQKLHALTGDATIVAATTGEYLPHVFNGHCDGDGNKHYKLLSAAPETWRRVRELYDDVKTTMTPDSSRSATQ